MDKVEEDLSNLKEVMSDTLEICTDIWTIFWQSYTSEQGDFSKIVVGDYAPDIHPFTERFETILAGWTLNMRLSVPFDYNSCNLPMEAFSFPQDESFSSYINADDISWLAFYEFFFDNFDILDEFRDNYNLIVECVENSYLQIQMDKVCVVSKYPKSIKRNDASFKTRWFCCCDSLFNC